jgi:hypothetical protein
MIELPRSLRIFEMRDGIDYEFTMPHVSIGGEGTTQEMVAGRWRLTQRLDGREWTAEHESRWAAVLLLIAARMGFTGELHEAADEPAVSKDSTDGE